MSISRLPRNTRSQIQDGRWRETPPAAQPAPGCGASHDRLAAYANRADKEQL